MKFCIDRTKLTETKQFCFGHLEATENHLSSVQFISVALCTPYLIECKIDKLVLLLGFA